MLTYRVEVNKYIWVAIYTITGGYLSCIYSIFSKVTYYFCHSDLLVVADTYWFLDLSHNQAHNWNSTVKPLME